MYFAAAKGSFYSWHKCKSLLRTVSAGFLCSVIIELLQPVTEGHST